MMKIYLVREIASLWTKKDINDKGKRKRKKGKQTKKKKKKRKK